MAALLVCGPLHAQEYKIGVIHVERVLAQSPAAKAAHDKIQKEFEPRDRDIAARERDLRDAVSGYDRDKARLSDDERATRARELELRGREIERMRAKFAEDLRARQFEELDKLKEMLDRVITRIAQEKHYDLILQDALFVGRSVDITDEVIRALGQ
ncbi:MAG TPA: OmpH family outer membrane protein [Casimicrobiaceae bacterium]|nr:OmpH family outer membrane protein [Casimicrobiaceae bacterium]